MRSQWASRKAPLGTGCCPLSDSSPYRPDGPLSFHVHQIDPLETRVKDFLKEYGITIALVALSVALVPFSGLGPTYLVQELLTRLGRNAILVLALLPMLWAGMGFNFALGAGAMAAQIGMILAVAFNLVGLHGLAFAVLAGLPIAVFVGWISGLILNRMKGMEMVISYCLVPYLFDGFYLLIVLYLMGSLIPLPASDLLLSRGYGIRNTVEFEHMRQALDNLIPTRVGPFALSIGTWLTVVAVALLILWGAKTKLGQDIHAIGSDPQVAEETGIPLNRTRMWAVILSMVLACIGQVVFLQSMGCMATYNAHSQTTFFIIPCLIAGGATLRKVRVRHALIGTPVLHALLITMPMAFCEFFHSAELGYKLSSYIQLFAAYGLIALALIRYGMAKHQEAEAARQAQEAAQAPGPAPQ